MKMEKIKVEKDQMMKVIKRIINEDINHQNSVIRVSQRSNGKYLKVDDVYFECRINYEYTYIKGRYRYKIFHILIQLESDLVHRKVVDGYKSITIYKVHFNNLYCEVSKEELEELLVNIIGKKEELEKEKGKFYIEKTDEVFKYLSK